MKCKSLMIVLLSFCIKYTTAQEFEWIVDNTSSLPGERVVAVIDAGTVGTYTGVEIIGQVIDNSGNWGYQLPKVADFRMFVKFSGSFDFDLKQTVKTTRIKLGIRKVSPSKVYLVATCPYTHSAMRVIFKKIEGSPSVTMGDPNSIVSEGELILGEPDYESNMQITNQLEVRNGNDSYGAILARADETNFHLYSKTLSSQPQHTETFRLGLKYANDENNGFISFYRGGSTNGGFLGFASNGSERMRIEANGDIAIGKPSADAKLDVAGNIKAHEIEVTLAAMQDLQLNGTLAANNITYTANGNTADFVFEDNYQLKDLSEVEAFIKTNKHLPEIPSADEMEEAGVNLAEMNKLLLMKVEELTLYSIEQEKKIEELTEDRSRETEELRDRMAKMEALIEKLSNR